MCGGMEIGGRTTRFTVSRPPFKERRTPLLLWKWLVISGKCQRHRTTRRFRLFISVTVSSVEAALPFG
jgi:hypothetical protein